MVLRFPCEIVTWEMMPAFRRELARYMVVKKSLRPRQVARMLGVTDAAVSHYLKAKRGSGFCFKKSHMREIERIGEWLSGHRESVPAAELIERSCGFCKVVRSELSLCSIHLREEPRLGVCRVCRGL